MAKRVLQGKFWRKLARQSQRRNREYRKAIVAAKGYHDWSRTAESRIVAVMNAFEPYHGIYTSEGDFLDAEAYPQLEA